MQIQNDTWGQVEELLVWLLCLQDVKKVFKHFFIDKNLFCALVLTYIVYNLRELGLLDLIQET